MAVAQHTWIGKDVPRLEDPKLLAGRATYVNDISLPGMLEAAVLRSPIAHPHYAHRHYQGARAAWRVRRHHRR